MPTGSLLVLHLKHVLTCYPSAGAVAILHWATWGLYTPRTCIRR